MAPDDEQSRLAFEHNPDELDDILASEEFHELADSIATSYPPQPITLDLKSGDMIDGYKLIELLGSGGMGEIWRAEQGGSEKLQVALKVILLGMNSEEVCTRFNAERRALAIMDHPGIAKVYDGGATEKGRPYFVMELVEGIPITDYARDGNLTVDERLDLVSQTCEALQHAHLRGVVHRDLKPSNILVSLSDGKPVIKMIDFGIAKALEGSAASYNTTITLAGQIVGTLGYMSPEQTVQDTSHVDPRADVYSLGAILYELLTDVLPVDVSDLSKGQDEAMRLIRHEIPKKPSSHNARARGLFGKELDWVVMKTLEKEPSRRYQSAAAFGEDIQRLLQRQPVVARPASVPYVLRKWISRNRRMVVTCAAFVAIGLFAGAVGLAKHRREIDRTAEHAWLQRLLVASTLDAPKIVGGQAVLSKYLVESVNEEVERHPLESRAGMHARLLLMEHDGLHSPLARTLWQTLENDSQPDEERFHAAAILASHAAHDNRWSMMAPDVANWLADQSDATPWSQYFEPIGTHLLPTLNDDLFDRPLPRVRKNAAILLAAFLHDDLKSLQALAIRADASQMSPLVDAFKAIGPLSIDQLSDFLARDFRIAKTETERDELAKEQSRVGMALMLLGRPDKVTPYLEHPSKAGDPRLQSFLIHGFADYITDPSPIISFLKSQQPWIVRAGLLALGDYSLTKRRKDSLTDTVTQMFREHSDPGVHACAEWLLRHWYREDHPKDEDAEPDLPKLNRQSEPLEGQDWFVNRSGMTMVVIPGPAEFTMGVPEDEPGRQIDEGHSSKEILHRRAIPRSFAIASKELTFGEYVQFRPKFLKRARKPGKTTEANITHLTEAKVLEGISFNDALLYCNWLSKNEGLPPEQWCFEIPADPKGDVELKANFLSLRGYRLATEAEWEYASRSGSVTARPYGFSVDLLPRYAWYQENSKMHSWPPGILRPNAFGLFDVLGNRIEWVHGYHVAHPIDHTGKVADTELAVGLRRRPIQKSPHYSARGGSSDSRAVALTAGRRTFFSLAHWAVTIRLARTIRPDPNQ